jgi:uncharacterized protein (DUF952 family)
MSDEIVYKVMTAADIAALQGGVFEGSPVDRADGFIHLSSASQLTGTVDRHFAGQADLTIIALDLSALGEAIRWEPARGGQLFPHLYAPLRREAVLGGCALERELDGTVRAPSIHAPAIDAPATDAPANEAPANEAPANEAPANEAPAVDGAAVDGAAVDVKG